MIVHAYSYCVKKKNHSNPKYVAAIVKEWVNQGLRSIEQIEDYLEETDNRHYLYKESFGHWASCAMQHKKKSASWIPGSMKYGFPSTRYWMPAKEDDGNLKPEYQLHKQRSEGVEQRSAGQECSRQRRRKKADPIPFPASCSITRTFGLKE